MKKDIQRKRVDIVSLRLVKEGSLHYKEGNSRRLNGPDKVAKLPRKHMGGELDREIMGAISLNTKNEPTNISLVSQGTLNSSLAHPREIYKVAVASNANSIIIFHNHASGDSSPSREDMYLTERVKKAGEIMGIPLIDHIILGDGSYRSLKEEGVI